MALPWTQARDFSQVVRRQQRESLRDASIAARVAQADKAGWEGWMREIGGD